MLEIRSNETREQFIIHCLENHLGRPATELEKAYELAGPGYAVYVEFAARRLPANATADEIVADSKKVLAERRSANWS